MSGELFHDFGSRMFIAEGEEMTAELQELLRRCGDGNPDRHPPVPNDLQFLMPDGHETLEMMRRRGEL